MQNPDIARKTLPLERLRGALKRAKHTWHSSKSRRTLVTTA